jgi:hypothetical protein
LESEGAFYGLEKMSHFFESISRGVVSPRWLPAITTVGWELVILFWVAGDTIYNQISSQCKQCACDSTAMEHKGNIRKNDVELICIMG